MTWADVRAGLLLVVLLPHLFASLPLARSARRKNFDTPLARDELARLREVLAHFGWTPTHAELADLLHDISEVQVDLRDVVLGPARPFFRITGTGQAWGLFTYPDRFPAQLVVESRSGSAPYEVRYASLDPDADLAVEKFVYRRVRGVYDTNSDKEGRTWDPFVSWAAGEVFAADSTVTEVKVYFRRLRTFEPGEASRSLHVEGTRGERVRRRP